MSVRDPGLFALLLFCPQQTLDGNSKRAQAVLYLKTFWSSESRLLQQDSAEASKNYLTISGFDCEECPAVVNNLTS